MSNPTPQYPQGLPKQQVAGVTAREGAIDLQRAGVQKQLALIGGRKRKRQHKKMTGGTGLGGNSPTEIPPPISPPIVPNNGGSADFRGQQQNLYNKMAMLSGGVAENSTYDGGMSGGTRSKKTRKTRRHRRKTRKSKKTRKSRKYMKRRKYH